MFNSVIVTVAGGHIDSVDTVVNPVITSQVLGDILGDLAGHVSGDVIGNLLGHIAGDLQGTVINPVTAGAGQVDVVTTSVPLPFRDIAFWPCVSGEGFPPTFSGASYSTISNGLPGIPSVVMQGNQAITWPFVPRISFSGKKTFTVSGKFACTIAPAGADKHYLGINPQTTHSTTAGPAAQLEIGAGAISGYSVALAYLAGGAWTTTAPFIVNEPVASVIHSFEMVFTDTTLVVSIDGTLVATINAAVWPSTNSNFSAPVPPFLQAVAGVSGRSMYSAMQIAWTT